MIERQITVDGRDASVSVQEQTEQMVQLYRYKRLQGGAGFESRSVICYPNKFCVDYTSPSRQMPGQHLYKATILYLPIITHQST